MATREFALDPSGTNRVQVQWTSGNEPAYVLFNGSILGQFATGEERMQGKAFSLPGGYPLHVRFANEQPEAFLNGAPLWFAPAITDPKPAIERSGRLMFWIFASLGLILISTALNALAFVESLVTDTNASLFVPLLFSIFIGIAGIIGLSLLFARKKWGFYLIVGYVIANVLMAVVYHESWIGTVLPFIGLVRLYILLNRTNYWDNLS